MKPQKFIKCTRCGLCCLGGACRSGIENDTSICVHLRKNDKIYSCLLILNGSIDPNVIFKKGCSIRSLSGIIYESYMNLYAHRGEDVPMLE